jgi:hypothetical protein
LTVTGFTNNETDAINIVNLAQAALLIASFKKSGDQSAMVMLNNLKVNRTGTRIELSFRMDSLIRPVIDFASDNGSYVAILPASDSQTANLRGHPHEILF